MKPRFKEGDQVEYKILGKIGVVAKVVNLNDGTDLRAQGIRYYVDISGQRWSIAEPELEAAGE